MTRSATTFLVLLTLIGAPERLFAELPGVWFLNAGETSTDRVRISVGGTATRPPTSMDQVLMGWTFADESAPILFPGEEDGSISKAWTNIYESSEPVKWRVENVEPPFPDLLAGPGGELWLAPGFGGGAEDWRWHDLLDAVEAAYRHTELATPNERRGERTIGRLGSCDVISMAVTSPPDRKSWIPKELPGRARASVTRGHYYTASGEIDDKAKDVQVERFQRWMVDRNTNGACMEEQGDLQLFLIPDLLEEAYLLTVPSVRVESADFFDLNPQLDTWNPGSRELDPLSDPGETTIVLSPAQLANGGPDFDLCTLQRIAPLCQRQENLRSRLYTTTEDSSIPPRFANMLQDRCLKTLPQTAPQNACQVSEAWNQQPYASYRVGYEGDLRLAPTLVEAWEEGRVPPEGDKRGVSWRFDPPVASLEELGDGFSFHLLDSTQVRIELPAPSPAPAETSIRGFLAGVALGISLALLLAFLNWWQQRTNTGKLRKQMKGLRTRLTRLERLYREVDQSQVKTVADIGSQEQQPHHLAAIEEQLEELSQLLKIQEERIGEFESSQGLRDDLKQELVEWQAIKKRADETVSPLSRCSENQLLERSDGERFRESSGDQARRREQFARLRAEIEALGSEGREKLEAAFAAGDALGIWINQLWPVISGISGSEIPQGLIRELPEPAAREWQDSYQELQDFVAGEATVFRCLIGRSQAEPSSPASDFLEHAGWLDNSPDLRERIRNYLEPYGEAGRLSRITLALQYLVEAYPIEHRSREERKVFRDNLAQALQEAALEIDFHQLLGTIAAGIDLIYRPVRYYSSHYDDPKFDFIKGQIDSISLSERLGFEAKTDPTLIVRLKRPFFFEGGSGIFYAGHALVGRS